MCADLFEQVKKPVKDALKMAEIPTVINLLILN